jgi:hypothetical protein
MAWRLDTGDEVAYGHNCKDYSYCFSRIIRDVLKVNGTRHALEVASVPQAIGRHRPLVYLPGLRSSARTTRADLQHNI